MDILLEGCKEEGPSVYFKVRQGSEQASEETKTWTLLIGRGQRVVVKFCP
jgi:hypothetical protein